MKLKPLALFIAFIVLASAFLVLVGGCGGGSSTVEYGKFLSETETKSANGGSAPAPASEQSEEIELPPPPPF